MAALALFALKSCNDLKRETKARAVAEIEAQVANSVADTNKDADREMKRLLAMRDDRYKVMAVAKSKRKADDVSKRQADPVYRDWARNPVPQSVVDELRESARAASGIHPNAGNGQPGPAVRPESAGTGAGLRQRAIEALRLGPARPN